MRIEKMNARNANERNATSRAMKIRRSLKYSFASFALLLCFLTNPSARQSASPIYVQFHTNLGDIDVQLLPDDAPLTVANFLRYVDRGAYNASFIHRSVPGFV